MLKIIRKFHKFIPGWFKIGCYKLAGKRPWSLGYSTFKFNFVKEAINNPKIMRKFESREPFSRGYGYALDERVVEYPWFLSRVPLSAENILDVGSALNFKEILEFQIFKNKKIFIVNLNPEENCFWRSGISYIFADIRFLPFRNEYFDCISCISTLEHIGMDNFLYTGEQRREEQKPADFERAVLELKRVLKKDGKLLITVPFGKYQNFGRFQQFNSRLVNKVLEVFQPPNHRIDYYKYTKEGWNISSENLCKESEYFDTYKTKYFNKESLLGFDEDFAAAARAVACIELTK